MIARFRSWWWYIRKHWIVAMTFALVIAVMVIIFTESLINGTGFDGYYATSTTRTISGSSSTITSTETYQPGKTLWDWLELLATLAIPVVVGLGAAWYTTQQGKVSEWENKDNQREAALQAYIDKMSELLLEKGLRESAEDAEVRKIAYVRTLTVLPRLDPKRKRGVLHFLYRSGLINVSKPIVSLDGADLREADLSDADLERTNLGGIDLLDSSTGNPGNLSPLETYLTGISQLSDIALSIVRLNGVNLNSAYLVGTNLKGSHLFGANLNDAILRGADLSDAYLIGVSLQRADLRGTNLNRARLTGAILNEADLSGAKLEGAIGVTVEELEKQAASLKGTTMIDGKIHL